MEFDATFSTPLLSCFTLLQRAILSLFLSVLLGLSCPCVPTALMGGSSWSSGLSNKGRIWQSTTCNHRPLGRRMGHESVYGRHDYLVDSGVCPQRVSRWKCVTAACRSFIGASVAQWHGRWSLSTECYKSRGGAVDIETG